MSGETMRAVLLKEPGGPESLDVEQVAIPEPQAGEALVRVHAAALTRDELEWPLDRLPAIPSYELSGVVESVGPGADGLSEGDEVFALTAFDRDGAAAEYVVGSGRDARAQAGHAQSRRGRGAPDGRR